MLLNSDTFRLELIDGFQIRWMDMQAFGRVPRENRFDPSWSNMVFVTIIGFFGINVGFSP